MQCQITKKLIIVEKRILNWITPVYRLSSYCAVNTLRLSYKTNQLILYREITALCFWSIQVRSVGRTRNVLTLHLVVCKVTSNSSTGLQRLAKLLRYKYFLLTQIIITPSKPYFSFGFVTISNIYRLLIHMRVETLTTQCVTLQASSH